MIVVKFATVILFWLYAGFIFYAIIGFIKTKLFTANSSHKNHTKTSIVICARNEETTIERCLNSILEQEFDFSLVEMIIVNDNSSDRTLFIAENVLRSTKINYRLYTNAEHLGKKKSIINAIAGCTGNFIITRDADTYTESKLWLKTIVDFYEFTKKEFIIAPVNYQSKNSFLGQLQYFENSALAIFTGGFSFFKKSFLCNGANLAFTKSLFQSTGAYKNHLNISTGDDVLFMEDVKKIKPETIVYLKQVNSVVYTYPLENLQSLFKQKNRWISKTGQNPNKFNELLGFLVFMIHFFSVFYLLLPFITHHISPFGIIFISIRFIIDFLLLFLASRYFNKPVNLFWYLPISLFYSVYVLITGFLSLIVKPNWK